MPLDRHEEFYLDPDVPEIPDLPSKPPEAAPPIPRRAPVSPPRTAPIMSLGPVEVAIGDAPLRVEQRTTPGYHQPTPPIVAFEPVEPIPVEIEPEPEPAGLKPIPPANIIRSTPHEDFEPPRKKSRLIIVVSLLAVLGGAATYSFSTEKKEGGILVKFDKTNGIDWKKTLASAGFTYVKNCVVKGSNVNCYVLENAEGNKIYITDEVDIRDGKLYFKEVDPLQLDRATPEN